MYLKSNILLTELEHIQNLQRAKNGLCALSLKGGFQGTKARFFLSFVTGELNHIKRTIRMCPNNKSPHYRVLQTKASNSNGEIHGGSKIHSKSEV